MDETACRAAVRSRDPRFDGRFVHAVASTGIYCRPSCPARTPAERHMRFYPSAAAAQSAGFRACKRCRPDASPGSPEWDVRDDTVARAMRLIGDGLVDRAGVPGLATALGYSPRQLERLLRAQLGAGPLALAAAARVRNARTLVEATTMSMGEVAFAAGYTSIRSFNAAVRSTYATTPSDLRSAARRGRAASVEPIDGPGTSGRSTTQAPGRPTVRDRASGPGAMARARLRLAYREPLEVSNLLGHLVATAVPGVEEWRDGAYRSTVRLPHGWGIVAVRPPSRGAFTVTLHLSDPRDLPAAVARTRRMLDLDADPAAIDAALAGDPVLAPLVARTPGRRVPRCLDPEAMALRAVLGQQVSTAAARTHAARLVAVLGDPVEDPDGGLTHLFPTAARIAAEPGAVTAALAMPTARQATLLTLAGAVSDGRLDLGPGADWDEARHVLSTLPGIGPWTAGTIAMRALGDPDAFVAADLGVRSAARMLGLPTGAGLERASRAWSPWRAYAVQHLWALGPHPVNQLPEDS